MNFTFCVLITITMYVSEIFTPSIFFFLNPIAESARKVKVIKHIGVCFIPESRKDLCTRLIFVLEVQHIPCSIPYCSEPTAGGAKSVVSLARNIYFSIDFSI